MSRIGLIVAFAAFAVAATAASAQTTTAPVDPRLEGFKKEAAAKIDARAKMTQEMVDSVFSFGELGFQEVETSRYLTGQLEKFGFKVERGVAGIPTAWVAKWGSGKPVIARGSDIDGIPQASQKPVAHRPFVAEERGVKGGAPKYGTGGEPRPAPGPNAPRRPGI